jgi:hypothetical protein
MIIERKPLKTLPPGGVFLLSLFAVSGYGLVKVPGAHAESQQESGKQNCEEIGVRPHL